MLPVQNILYPTDFSPTAEHALEHARFLAAQHDATLHVLHVLEPPRLPVLIDTDTHLEKLREENAMLLQTLQKKMASGEDPNPAAVKTKMIEGIPAADHILTYADSHDIDLIVIGTHGRRGPERLLMGSVAEAIIREAPCPVFTVRGSETSFAEKPLSRILAPVDFSTYGRYALALAKEMAATFEARLDVLHVIEPLPALRYYQPQMPTAGPVAPTSVSGTTEDLEKRARHMMVEMVNDVNGPDVDVAFHLGRDHVPSYIIDFAEAENVGLIVMATHGLTGIERFLVGSVTERVMRAAPCPVLVVRPPAQGQLQEASTALDEHSHEMITT